MCTKAQAILDEIRAPSPKDRREIAESLRTGGDGLPAKRESVRHVRGMFAGGGLPEALLNDRARERVSARGTSAELIHKARLVAGEF